MMSNKTYDRLKWIALIFVPAFATFVNVIGGIWGISYSDELTATITAVGAFMGACLHVSSKTYAASENGGTLVVSDEGDVYASFDTDPKELRTGDSVAMHVKKQK